MSQPPFDRSLSAAETPIVEGLSPGSFRCWTFPYTVMIRLNEEGDYVVRSPDLPGCMTHGENVHEALERFHEVYRIWMEMGQEAGLPTPTPLTEDEFLRLGRAPKRPAHCGNSGGGG